MRTSAEWRDTTLGAVTKVLSGSTPSTKEETYWDGDIPWITPKDLAGFNGVYIHSGERNITETGLKNSSAQLLPKYTVLFSSRAPIGYVAITDQETTTNQGFKNLVCDEIETNYLFIYYWLKANTYAIERRASGSTFREASATVMRTQTILLPSYSEQLSIASVLSSLDDKIELLRKQNRTLEQIARTLFSEQFVKKSANGELPEGWSIGRFGEEFQIVMGQSPKGETFNTNADGMVFFQGRTDFQERFPQTRLYTTEPIRIAEPFDVLVSVRAPVGDINVAIEKCCIGRGLAAIRSDARSYALYKTLSIQDKIRAFDAEGTVFGSVSKTDLTNIEVAVPPKKEVASFEQAVAPIDRKILNNSLHVRALAEIRDLLLPKLMRGEVRVGVSG